MQKRFLILSGVLSGSLIVLLAGATVNHRIDGKSGAHGYRMADGVPLPPPTQPPPKLGNIQMADGVPLPPPTQPPPKFNSTEMADGVPLPPPTQPPPKHAAA